MSLFTALNFTPDEALQEAEQHSRELQVEESFKVYQSALLHLKAKKFEQAEDKFKELFSIDVIKADRWGQFKYSSAILETLRYLAYRNRGVFYYRYLQDKYGSIEPHDVVEYTLRTVENLIDALQHGDCDFAVSKLLLDIFTSFRSPKLQRLVLEYELVKSSELTMTLNRRRSVLPETRGFIFNYVQLLKELRDTLSLEADSVTRLKRFIASKPENVSPLPPFLSQIQKMRLEDSLSLKEPNVIEAEINEISWEAVADAITSALPKYKHSNFFSRISDPYNEAEEPIEHLKFVFKEADNDHTALESEQTIQEPKAATIMDDAGGNGPHRNQDASTITNDAVEDQLNGNKRKLESDDADKPSQRSSKRFKEKPPAVIDSKNMDTHERFFNVINDISISLGYSFRLSVEKMNPLDLDQEAPEFCAISDLYECLGSWTNKHSEFLNQSETKNSRNSESEVESSFQLNALIRTSVLSGDNCPIESLTDLPSDEIQTFIDKINLQDHHFQEVRLQLLDILLSTRQDGRCLIIDTFWSPLLFKAVESLVMSVDGNLYYMMVENNTRMLSLGLSTYEILVNMMGIIHSNINAKRLQGQKINELETQKNKLERKISTWTVLLEDVELKDERSRFRFLWAKFCSLQYTIGINDDKLIDSLQEMEGSIEKHAPSVNVPYSNYSTIPQLNLKAVQSQLSRLKIVRKITSIDINAPSHNNDAATEQQMQLIKYALVFEEKMRMEPSEEDSMEAFLKDSPFLLKVKLWRLLISYYSRRDMKLAVSIFFRILNILHSKICCANYKAQSHLQRQQTLLLTISCMGGFTRDLLDLIFEHLRVELVEQVDIKPGLLILLKWLNLLYPIVFFESLCQNDSTMKSFFSKAKKSSSKLKNIFADLVTSTIYICRILESCDPNFLKRQYGLIDLIETSHELMGQFNFCDASNGSYLSFSEQILCDKGDEKGFKHIRQVLWCQYHFIVGGENSTVKQHNTKGREMNQESAVAAGKFLIDSHYSDKNLLIACGNKTNLKQILDNIIQVIGDVNFMGNHILARNDFFLEQYLKSMITTDIFRAAYAGEISVELLEPNDGLQSVADTGIFYVAAIQALNLYKVRKKATQARPSELDSIITTLKTDILYKTERFESWFLLGKCYSFRVEDDLIWTSDKLATHEKRRGTTELQRQSILCYLMALGIATRNRSKFQEGPNLRDYHQILKELLETLSEELLNGFLKPMEKSCFQWNSPSALKLKADGEICISSAPLAQSVSDYNIEQAILVGLSKAIQIETVNLGLQLSQRNWKSFYYSAKIIFKRCMREFKSVGLDMLLEACSLSEDAASTKDVILEPHYFLVTSCFKLVPRHILTAKQALSYLRLDNSVFKKEDSFWECEESNELEETSKNFNEKILDLLRCLVALDKTKWHHRPKYRIARILYDQFGDLDGAIAEMDEIMFLKSSNKSLVNIWKPEFERPGKHFIYTYQYVMFYLDLLFCRHDYTNIALVAKKLKRFGAGMVNVGLASDRALRLFCQAVQHKFNVNEKQAIDKLLPALNYAQFINYSDEIFQTFDATKYDPEVLATLTHALHLKKGNNGYDGICMALYFTYIYQPFVSQKTDGISSVVEVQIEPRKIVENGQESVKEFLAGTPLKGKPTTSRKKVSKKDAFDKITALVEKKIT
ncbi:LAME_0E13410g1_1 [Lachancea meyersii CBS 8951]|uniref:LAME_0E13410g1_1 n=1 Tax=Lachancea meyersii CBS 8951 TaxID=1266667 RepID=A0A1G4JM97_9SACH|nr:LAME_0E13410g1_1 [Lachancea meyersii CBS 8951]